MGGPEMEEIARLIAEAAAGRSVGVDAHRLRERFPAVQFGYSGADLLA